MTVVVGRFGATGDSPIPHPPHTHELAQAPCTDPTRAFSKGSMDFICSHPWILPSWWEAPGCRSYAPPMNSCALVEFAGLVGGRMAMVGMMITTVQSMRARWSSTPAA